MPNLPLMPFIIIVLFLLPFRLCSRRMKILAFSIWMTGGLILVVRGLLFLVPTFSPAASHAINIGMIVAFMVPAVVVGLAKGKWVLSKTSRRNIDRIDQFTEPMRPLYVYSVRSWIIIALMAAISLSMTVFNAPDFWRGLVNVAIGTALISSSFAYCL